MEWKGKWIGPAQSMGDVCPVFVREFNKGDFPGKEVESVQLQVKMCIRDRRRGGADNR